MKLLIVLGCIVAVALGAPSAEDIQKTIDNVIDKLNGIPDSIDISEDVNLKEFLGIDSTIKNGSVVGLHTGFKRVASTYDDKTKTYHATIEFTNTKLSGDLTANDADAENKKEGSLECTIAKISAELNSKVADADDNKIQFDTKSFAITLKVQTGTDNKCQVNKVDDAELTRDLNAGVDGINAALTNNAVDINNFLVAIFNKALDQGAAFMANPFALLIMVIAAFTYLV